MDDEFVEIGIDCLRLVPWMLGNFIRQFDLGRRGYPPEFMSKGFRDAFHEGMEEGIKKYNERLPSKDFPMGFS